MANDNSDAFDLLREKSPDLFRHFSRTGDEWVMSVDALESRGSGTKFVIEDILGHGGQGTVLLARDASGIRSALKTFREKPHLDQRTRFEREQRSLKLPSISHPCIPRLTGSGYVETDWPFLLMEFVPGLNLGKLISTTHLQAQKPSDQQYKVSQSVSLCLALTALHDCDLLHRDVKPLNLIVSTNGLVKLVDLGLVKDREEPGIELTQLGEKLGTLAYMSPEQYLDPRRVDSQSDQYSLGASLFHWMSGDTP
jgi:serine/threonine protein kinase